MSAINKLINSLRKTRYTDKVLSGSFDLNFWKMCSTIYTDLEGERKFVPYVSFAQQGQTKRKLLKNFWAGLGKQIIVYVKRSEDPSISFYENSFFSFVYHMSSW